MAALDYSPFVVERDDLALSRLLGQAFHFPLDRWPVFRDRIGADCLRVVRRGGELVGGFGFYAVGQWFGGRSLPCAAVAAVGVAPEVRGLGIAATMMLDCLREQRERGVPLLALYASTQRLYRKVGFEQAGSCVTWQLPLQGIAMRDRELAMAAIDSRLSPQIEDLYRRYACSQNGLLERNDAIWQRVFRVEHGEPLHTYRIGPEAAAEGYLVFEQKGPAPGPCNLELRDLVALTPAAWRRVLALFGDHSSLADHVLLQGPMLHPLLLQLPEQTARITGGMRWMLRIADVERALTARGYATAARGALHLSVEDPLLAENSGRYVLDVEAGQASVSRGGRGDLAVDIRGLAPLFSGLLGARGLRDQGFCSGDDEAVLLAESIFQGCEPWMLDRF